MLKLLATEKVMTILKTNIGLIIENNGLNNTNEIYTFLIEYGYEALPLPVRMLVKKEIFVSTIKNNSTKVYNIVNNTLKND